MSTIDERRRLLTVREAAAILRLSPETVRRYEQVSELPGVRLSRGALRFERAAAAGFEHHVSSK